MAGNDRRDWEAATEIVVERGLATWNVLVVGSRRRSLLGFGESPWEACDRALDWMAEMRRPQLWELLGARCRDEGEYRINSVRRRIHDLILELARTGGSGDEARDSTVEAAVVERDEQWGLAIKQWLGVGWRESDVMEAIAAIRQRLDDIHPADPGRSFRVQSFGPGGPDEAINAAFESERRDFGEVRQRLRDAGAGGWDHQRTGAEAEA